MNKKIVKRKAFVDKSYCVACGVCQKTCPMGTMTQGICIVKEKINK